MDLNRSLQSSVEPVRLRFLEQKKTNKKLYTYHFAKLKPNSFVSQEVSLCVASRFCSAFISRLSILSPFTLPPTSTPT